MSMAQLLMGDYGPFDPDISSVVFLANFETALTDLRGHSISTSGTPPAVNGTNPFNGANSCNFPGAASDALVLGDSADWTFPGAFTVENWFYYGAGGTATMIFNIGGVIGTTQPSLYILVGAANLMRYGASSNGTTLDIVNNASFGMVINNGWNLAEVTWDGSNYRAFINGVLGDTTASSTAMFDSTLGISLGNQPTTTWGTGYAQALTGALGPMRITKGVCRHTANYTPIQVPFPTR